LIGLACRSAVGYAATLRQHHVDDFFVHDASFFESQLVLVGSNGSAGRCIEGGELGSFSDDWPPGSKLLPQRLIWEVAIL
jgi:hypothetical protein